MILDIVADPLRCVESRFAKSQREIVGRVNRIVEPKLDVCRRRVYGYLDQVDKPAEIRLIVEFIYLS